MELQSYHARSQHDQITGIRRNQALAFQLVKMAGFRNGKYHELKNNEPNKYYFSNVIHTKYKKMGFTFKFTYLPFLFFFINCSIFISSLLITSNSRRSASQLLRSVFNSTLLSNQLLITFNI